MINVVKNISSVNNEIIKELYKRSRNNDGSTIILNFFKSLNEYDNFLEFEYLICTQEWYDINQKYIDIKINTILIVPMNIIKKLSFVNTDSQVLGITSHKYDNVLLSKGTNYLLIEKISDPNNLASIIRSAICFNIKNIFITKNSVSPYNEKVLRGTVGSFKLANINIVNDLKEIIINMKKIGIEVIATHVNKESKTLSSYKFSGNKNYAIIIGNESKGISNEILELSSEKIYIDMENINSLNASNATSIIMFQLYLGKKCVK